MDPVVFTVPGDLDGSRGASRYRAEGEPCGVLLVLAHGAGGGQAHPFMTRYARGLATRGLDVVTFDFPYLQAGRRTPDRAPVLEDAFRRAIAAAVTSEDMRGRRLFIGGKSMGGRMATHLAAAPDAWPAGVPPLSGVVVFGYPLNPPGGPSRRSPDRVSHLQRITVPTLLVQGTRDSFGGPDLIQAAMPAAQVHAVVGGDHSLGARYDADIWDQVVAFVSST